ncbi:MAG: radical SAM protein, partial [Candidatus Aminicenantes bacterium]
KSFCGGSRGAVFSKRAPLAAGGSKEIEFDFALAGGYSHNIDTVVESLITGAPVPGLQPLDDLDQLPFPDRSLLTSYAEQGGAVDQKPGLQKSTLIRTSTGCLNNCSFCQRKAWHKKYQAHSISYVLREFSELKKHHYRNIWITDDNFTFDLKRAKSLLKELSDRGLTGGMKIALSSWTRIDEEFLEAAKKAYVSIISFGVETANREIQRFYRKKIDLDRFRDLIGYADQIGLYTVGNFIIGAPMETGTTIKETFDYILDTPFDQVNVKILDYMAGSDLYAGLLAEKRGIGRHLFACQENGLNEFPLEVLKGKIKDFKVEFQRSREGRLKEKINRYGPPYYLLR